jgi:hypothetical protein
MIILVLAISVFNIAGQQHAEALFSGATDQACSGVNLSDGNTTCADSTSSVTSIVQTVVTIISWIVGIASIIMIIFGGFRFVTSGGDANATASARNTIIYAVIGLAVAAIAEVLVRFVIFNVG